MTIREIEPQEWERLAPIYEANGDHLPPQESNRVFIAECKGKIVGMCGLNVIAHAGPIWVDPNYRGRGVAELVIFRADDAVRALGGSGYFMFPSTPASAKVVERLGLKQRAWKVFERIF